MKKCLISMVLIWTAVCCGCANRSELDRAMALRADLLGCHGYRFDTTVTADYGEQVYTFAMACQSDNRGNLTFTVKEPESISGISGQISQQGGKITFDDTALAFELLADGQVTPVSAPWILVHTLHDGYMTACSSTEQGLILSIDETYEEDSLNLTVWLGENDLPTGAEILYRGSRILSLTVENFTYL